jgi:hypothetical protein
MSVVANTRSIHGGPVIYCADRLGPLAPAMGIEEVQSIIRHRSSKQTPPRADPGKYASQFSRIEIGRVSGGLFKPLPEAPPHGVCKRHNRRIPGIVEK